MYPTPHRTKTRFIKHASANPFINRKVAPNSPIRLYLRCNMSFSPWPPLTLPWSSPTECTTSGFTSPFFPGASVRTIFQDYYLTTTQCYPGPVLPALLYYSPGCCPDQYTTPTAWVTTHETRAICCKSCVSPSTFSCPLCRLSLYAYPVSISITPLPCLHLLADSLPMAASLYQMALHPELYVKAATLLPPQPPCGTSSPSPTALPPKPPHRPLAPG
jgi:hypothetical protein